MNHRINCFFGLLIFLLGITIYQMYSLMKKQPFSRKEAVITLFPLLFGLSLWKYTEQTISAPRDIAIWLYQAELSMMAYVAIIFLIIYIIAVFNS